MEELNQIKGSYTIISIESIDSHGDETNFSFRYENGMSPAETSDFAALITELLHYAPCQIREIIQQYKDCTTDSTGLPKENHQN